MNIENLNNSINKLKIERKELLIKVNKNKDEVDRLNKLSDKLYNLEKELLLLKKPAYSNQVIDLYLDEENKKEDVEYYNVTLHNEYEIIGYIRVNLKHFNMYLGHIGYSINPSYRGNGYALQSLELLRKPMITKGLSNIIITAHPENFASIKTIEKFGGVLKSEAHDEQDWNIYQVNLMESNNNKK